MDAIDLIREGRIKRYFRATRKLNAAGLVSHITQRAAGKEPLFLEDDDYLSMLGLLKQIAEKYRIEVYTFCLMQNHVHLLFRPGEENLYDAMRDLFSRYAVRFNHKYERKGHLFGGPYRQAVCLDDTYLLSASLYIHWNPARAGLVSDPLRYRWSSCRLYCEENAPVSFVKPDFILGLLSGAKGKTKKKYHLMLNRGNMLEPGHVLEQEDAIERFRHKLSSLFPLLFRRIAKKKEVARTSGLDLLDIELLEKEIQGLRKGCCSARKPETREAKKYLIEQLVARGYARGEIAERLGVSRKTVYNILKTSV